MVGVFALEVVDVQRHAGVIDESLEELAHELTVELADHGRGKGAVKEKARAPRQVEHHARERLVQGNAGLAVAHDALFVAQGVLEGLTDHDAGVFDRVVTVDFKVSLDGDRQVNEAVPGNLLEHVIEKADAGRYRTGAGAVQVQADFNLRFFGVTGNDGGTHQRFSQMTLISAPRACCTPVRSLSVTGLSECGSGRWRRAQRATRPWPGTRRCAPKA